MHQTYSGPEIRVFWEYVVYLLVRLTEEAFCLLPSHDTALKIGRLLGRLMFLLAWDRRKAAIENLQLAFGNEMSPDERRALARKNFEHLGMLAVEFFRIRRWDQKEIAERLVITGKENFDLAWAPGKHGIFYVAAHYGSFEVLAAVSKFLGLRGNLIVTKAPNRFVNERMLFRRGGDESGLSILPHTGIVKHVINALQDGEMAVVLADQRGDDTRPVWVDFFGVKALANAVFAKFALEGKAHTFPVVATRMADGRYLCRFEDEIPIQSTGDYEHDLMVNSQRFHRVFERWLREDPSQGFWMHRKFKRKSRKKRKAQASSAGSQPLRLRKSG
ncbi:MAG: lysophospholipid acyltransferase family protein [Desulfomonilaceae bacterium]